MPLVFRTAAIPEHHESFTANHTHLVPDSTIEEFVGGKRFTALCRKVRRAGNSGVRKIHQHLGKGTVK
jgi:hypothetical protein